MSQATMYQETVIGEEAVEFYERTGWYISDLFIDDATIDKCIEAAENIYRGQYQRVQEWSSSPHIKNFGVEYTDRSKLRIDQFPSFHSDAIRKVVHSREIGAIAGHLLRTQEIRYYKDILIGKPKQSPGVDSAIGWHTDISYWPTCVAERMMTVYVPLQDRDESSGTLLMMSGSQKWVSRSFNITAAFDEAEKLKAKYEGQGHKIELEPLVHKKGQVSFHSSLVIHAAYPNITDKFQHTIVFGLQAKDNRFVPSPLKRLNKSLVVNLNDEIGPKLPDGSPDITNDEFYPVLYRAPGAE